MIFNHLRRLKVVDVAEILFDGTGREGLESKCCIGCAACGHFEVASALSHYW
jgi:hypothetical protein